MHSSFEDRGIDAITPQEIERWLSSNSKMPATFNRYRALFSLAFRLAIANGTTIANPARLVRCFPFADEAVPSDAYASEGNRYEYSAHRMRS
jgi:hypothetical protein